MQVYKLTLARQITQSPYIFAVHASAVGTTIRAGPYVVTGHQRDANGVIGRLSARYDESWKVNCKHHYDISSIVFDVLFYQWIPLYSMVTLWLHETCRRAKLDYFYVSTHTWENLPTHPTEIHCQDNLLGHALGKLPSKIYIYILTRTVSPGH